MTFENYDKKGIPEKVSLSFIKCGKPLRKVTVIRNKELNDLFNERMRLYGFEKENKIVDPSLK